MTIVIEIGGKPEGKGRGRVGRIKTAAGKDFTTVFTPAHTRKYENLIRLAAAKEMGDRPPIETAVEVWVHVYLPFPKSMSKANLTKAVGGFIRPTTKPDIDNYVKSALDGIINIVIRDDNQVVSLYAHKVYRSRPALRIEVRECYKSKKLEDLE